ncbi:MAG: DUF6268 family outer membrane beta-barrel protein [Burkholderiales bacterium]
MQRRCWIAAALAALPGLPLAQALPPGTTVGSAALTGIAQLDTDLDAGGSVRWAGGIASGSLLRQFTPQFAAGISLQYDYQQWRFDKPVAFRGIAPWGDIQQPRIGLTFAYAPAADWRVLVSPSVAWAYENGASAGDALEYGAVVVASKVFSPTLTLGLGAAIYRQIDQTKTFPFLAIDWKIDDQWRLSNPFPAGPVGGAGLELSYAFAEGWEAGIGGTYRSYQFRLDRDGPVPGGIGENRAVPLFLRLSRNIGKDAQVDFHAAALVNGRLRVKNQDGQDLASDDYATAPALGLTVRYRF